jgi:hypothetical protein
MIGTKSSVPFLSDRLKKLYVDSIATAILALLMIGIAVGFTFVEDWCRAQARPEWLINCFQGLSILLFVTDSIALAAVCINIMIESIRGVFASKP